jgi:hypothetical protein
MPRGKWFALFVVITAAVPALSQPPPTQAPGARRGQPEPSLQGEQKLRWVCKQLKLDEPQMQKVDALIQVYKAEVEEQRQDPAALLQRIQDKYAELRAAESDGNAEKARQLRAELKEMTPGAQAEGRFFTDLEQVLTEEQKTRLPAVRKRAESVGDVAMKPVHVLRAAQKAGLTAEQNQKLEALAEAFRGEIVANRPENPQAAAERVDKLVDQVRELLTPAQRPAFDKEIEEVRDNPPPATALQPPATQPSK